MRSGFVSIIGRPNAGKSTLLNALTGEKVAIVTAKPQTTRTRIQGVVEVPARKGKHPAAQIVFVDTPGVHKPSTQLDRRMMQEVHDALEQRDIVLLMLDATRELRLPEEPAKESAAKARSGVSSEDKFALELIRKLDCPVFLIINKIDLVEREKLLPLIARLSALHDFAAVVPISARKRDGLERLITELVKRLPEGQRYYPPEQYTDQPERFLVAELIRERILMETGEEVPYASAVVIERYEEPPADAKPRKDGKLPRYEHRGGHLLRTRRAKSNFDREGRRETQSNRRFGAQGDRVVAGHARLSGVACDCRRELARIARLCRVIGLAQAAH